jgi:shikimate kinase
VGPAPKAGRNAGPESSVRRVVLVGFMGSGKTTVGALLAAELGWEFLDLDAEIERREGREIPAIFRGEGEAAFRAIEHHVARELRVSADASFDRTGAHAVTRPLLQVADPPSRIRELLAQREPYYRGAHWWVDTDLHSPPEIARQVAQRLRDDPERPLRQ